MFRIAIFITALAGLLAASWQAQAGIETPLLVETQGDCTVRVVHDATPDSTTGTLVFRSYRVIDGVHHPCDLDRAQVAASLGRGIAAYLERGELKPATSILVGRISRFPWVRAAWRAQGQSGTHEKLTIAEFDALVASDAIAQPFAQAVAVNGLAFAGASCEKHQYHPNGAPMDALCWFLVK